MHVLFACMKPFEENRVFAGNKYNRLGTALQIYELFWGVPEIISGSLGCLRIDPKTK